LPEKYEGVKFKLKEGALKRASISDERIRDIIHFAKVLFEKGFADENSGNISIRKGNGFLIKATGARFSNLTEEDFAFVEKFDLEKFELQSASGYKLPSSETPMHALIYSVRKDAQAIVHCHAFPKGAPVTKKQHPYGTIEQAKAVSELLRTSDMAISKNHGVFSVGKTVAEATERILTKS
jgi:ribulose-5-phosphate 4-epimerase/fuculose-1-phosphate aldolase